jgi:hypothetical protein
MKRKKVEVMRDFNFWTDNFVKIDKEGDQYYFEIGSDITTDLAEAVAIMMNYKNKEADKFWELQIKDINYYDIKPEQALYWLSGGDYEWKVMNNYKKIWSEVSLDFQEEFGLRIISILKKSKTMRDIRDGFLKYLNLPILYEFALEKELV